MTPRIRSILHALGFLALLAILYLVSLKLDIPGGQPGAVLGAYGHQLLLDIGNAITLAVSLNLILGIAGQFSLGHAGFVAAGAYTAAMISGIAFPPILRFLTISPFHLSTPVAFQLIMILGMLAGTLIAAILGLLVGLPTLRLRGDYLAIATLGFGEILAVFFQNFTWDGNHVFGGSTGLSLSSLRNEWISNQPDPDAALPAAVQAFLDRPDYLVGSFAVFGVTLLTIYIVHNIKYATSGRALLAIREDTIASESVGVASTRYKVAAFVIGAALAGLAGGLIAHHKSLVNPESFRFMRSIEIVAMVILGGQGSITGSILAAIALTLLPEVLRSYIPEQIMSANTVEKWRMVIYSLFIILAMLFRPQGIFGRYEISDLFRWLFKRTRSVSAGPSPAPQTGGLPAQTTIQSAAAQTPLLIASNITMQFGGLKAIDNFSLTLLPGELVGLIGPNGAGKTTAFNVLTSVYRPTAGQIIIAGKPTRRLKPHAISQLGVARTFQNIRLFANLSVLDNVQIAQHAHHKQGIPSAILRRPAFYREEDESRRNALAYLQLFNLGHLADELANSLSYGDQRRLEIARALATRPRILCLDEPAAGMNPTEKRELMEMIRRIRDQFSGGGLTILLIEHDMKVIMGICERILVLDYGKTIATGTPEEIRNNPAVIEAYLGASAKHS
ncbi:MAG TPA: branched-chain amino acid ABC transporter ATP-binding protein/permease [Phycisphaerae bacterium]|nr:branched-chain amino acid ABC transporter ATP-binding protein/permease [Phycisphaerae bacterium]